MSLEKNNFHNRAIEKVKLLWHLYILGDNPQQMEEEFGQLADNMLMIGTGRQEMYKTKEQFLYGMSVDQMQARDIRFELQDEWYEVQEISKDVCVVYGNIWAREVPLSGQEVFVDMEGSRFTVICRDTENGVQMCSIHHSMPYIEQGTDEYYPKTLSSLARELEHRMELDHMTELYNRYYMEQHVTHEMKQTDGYFFILDLDNFKNINDTMGHLMGDQAIQEFSNMLREVFSQSTILGRMGGDEFALWNTDIKSCEEANIKFGQLLEGCRKISAKLEASVSCSAGIAFCTRSSEEFAALYERADQALYHAKAQGKGRVFWAAEQNKLY